jgi:outer membrane biogenesis lipoprotein LolB
LRPILALLAVLVLGACALGLPSTTAEQEALQKQQQAQPSG